MTETPVADFFRQLLGRPLAPAEEEALASELKNLALDTVPGAPGSPQCAPTAAPLRKVSPIGIALIKQFEGCERRRADGRYYAYPDPGTGGDPWTIGWGATGMDGAGKRISRSTVWTGAQCDARLEADLARFAAEVARAIGPAPTSQAQFDAMVSFHYNTGAIARASLSRKHCSGDHGGAAREFARWVRAGGKVLPGLVRRRTAEATLYASSQTRQNAGT